MRHNKYQPTVLAAILSNANESTSGMEGGGLFVVCAIHVDYPDVIAKLLRMAIFCCV